MRMELTLRSLHPFCSTSSILPDLRVTMKIEKTMKKPLSHNGQQEHQFSCQLYLRHSREECDMCCSYVNVGERQERVARQA